jgi:alpha/beta superfamily hydrolase
MDNQPEIRTEVRNNRGWKIIGMEKSVSSDQMIIICHGYASSKDEPTLKLVAGLLQQQGFSTCRFDFSGSGESEGNKSLSLKQQVKDLQAVISHFSKYKHIYLIGGSLGALPVCICSSLNHIRGVITINGYFGGKIKLPKFRRSYYTLHILKWFVPRIRREFNYYKQMIRPDLIRKPMLMLVSPGDEVLDAQQSIRWYEMLTVTKKIAFLPQADHGVNRKTDAVLAVRTITRWIHGLPE